MGNRPPGAMVFGGTTTERIQFNEAMRVFVVQPADFSASCRANRSFDYPHTTESWSFSQFQDGN